MALTHRGIFERHVYASAISRDPNVYAAMFTEGRVFEAPLVPQGHPLPRCMVGRDAIRTETSAYQQVPAYQGTVNFEQSAYVLHEDGRPQRIHCRY